MGKTESIIFRSKRRVNKVEHFHINSMGQTLVGQNSVKYLGVCIDQHVSGEAIANNIIQKSNSKLKFLYRQASCLNQNCRKILCSALIQCHFDYAASAWYSGLSKNLKNRSQTTQNKMARFILNLGPRAHVDQELLSTLKCLNVESRVKFLKLCHVQKILNNNSASYLKEHFTQTSTFHRYNTRGSAFNFSVPKIKSHADSTFYFSAIREWNKLPENIKCIKSLHGFKSAIRKYLSNGDFQ